MELPAKAKIKLTLLADAQQAAQDATQSLMRRLSASERSINSAPASDRDFIEEEIARLRGKLDESRRKSRAATDLIARLHHFLETLSDAKLKDAKTKPPKTENRESLVLVAARIRTKIVALKAERRKVEHCAPPAAEAKEQAKAYVAELVDRGRPKIRFAHDRPFSASFDALIDGAYVTKQDIGAALAWLDPSAFLNKLQAEIDAQPAPAMALTGKERSEKLAALNDELLALEFEDEACVAAAEIDGPFILRRTDADPRAVLGITVTHIKAIPQKPARVRAEESEVP